MFKTDWTRNGIAMIATVLMSTACLTAAIGPAQPSAGKAAVAMAARFVA